MTTQTFKSSLASAMATLVIASCSPAPAFAAPFVTLGIAKADGGTCIRDYKMDTHKFGCSTSPLGYAAVGYEWRGFSAEVEHWSSLVEKDKGLNLFSIKYRYTFGQP